MNLSTCCYLQVAAAVRLRREAWGGVAFDRGSGDLLELDPEGFAVLAVLKTAHTLPDLQRSLRRLDQRPRRLELAAFLHDLEQKGFVHRVAPDAPPLRPDRWTEEAVAGPTNELRAPLVAHWAV